MTKLKSRIAAIFLMVVILISMLITSVPVIADDDIEGSNVQVNQELSLQGERIYQIMTDRFYDGDQTNNAKGEALRYQEVSAEDMTYMKGGDWQGIIDKLPYIKGMGYTAIWISPISDPQLWSIPDEKGVQGPTAYHGYHTADPYRASRYFGAEDPEESKRILKKLVGACHAQGIKVIFDVVPNHMGNFLQGIGQDAHYSTATQYKPGTQLQPAAPFNNPSWYHNQGDIDWDHEYPHTEASINMLETHDLSWLDDIDYDVPEAKQAMMDAIKYWYDYTGADAARVDAAKCMKPSDIHDLQEYLNVPTFGENFDMDVNFVSKWVGDNGEVGMLDFPLFQAIVDSFAHGGNFNDTVKSVLDKDYLYGKNSNEMVVFIDNHDRNRFLTEAGGDVKKLQNALTFLYTVRGIPVVFQGTEQNRGNMYGELMYGLADSWNRWSMVEKDSNGTVLNDYFDTSTDTYQLIAKLNSLKDEYPVLSYGTQREMWSSPNIYAFSRRIDSDTSTNNEMICTFNNSSETQTAYMPLRAESSIEAGTVLENVFDKNDRITVSQSHKIAVKLDGNSSKIYKVSNDQKKTTVPVTLYVEDATTDLGESVYIAGSTEDLGNWDPANAVGPAANPNYPTWSVTLNLPIGDTIQYKAIKKNGEKVTWEAGENRTYTVSPEGGALSFTWSSAGETTLVPVQFTVNDASTEWGENIYISGNVPQLGNWNAERAAGPALCPDYPNWTIYLDLPVGQTIEWKAIKKNSTSNITWQGGENNSFVVPTRGTGMTTTKWQ